jgi:hypothetical protein
MFTVSAQDNALSSDGGNLMRESPFVHGMVPTSRHLSPTELVRVTGSSGGIFGPGYLLDVRLHGDSLHPFYLGFDRVAKKVTYYPENRRFLESDVKIGAGVYHVREENGSMSMFFRVELARVKVGDVDRIQYAHVGKGMIVDADPLYVSLIAWQLAARSPYLA